MKEFEFVFGKRIVVQVDESLVPDDEWRSVFYDIYTLEEVAEHFAWNLGAMRFSDVEGYANVDPSKYKIVSSNWEGRVEDW